MPYPNKLTPTGTEELQLPSGAVVQIPKATPTFLKWNGPPPDDTYGSKAVLDLAGEPVFAEIAILRLLQSDGWQGVWIDTYRHKYRISIDRFIELPQERQDFLETIYARAGSESGSFDVFAWREDAVLFAESKRFKRDQIRDTQLRWLQAALEVGLVLGVFLIVEWQLAEG